MSRNSKDQNNGEPRRVHRKVSSSRGSTGFWWVVGGGWLVVGSLWFVVGSLWILACGLIMHLMAGRHSYENLEVYQRSYKLAVEVHYLSSGLPKVLQFDLADQIRRASRSIPSNIAEGFGRNRSNKDKVNFLINALGSNDEMLFNLKFMKDTHLISEVLFQKLHEEYTICGKQLSQLIKTLKQ